MTLIINNAMVEKLLTMETTLAALEESYLQLAANEAVCAECGRTFEVQNMIAYGRLRVCAECKPVFMQKLAEGAKIGTSVLNYAGFWTRFGAVFLDGIILWVVNSAISLGLGMGFLQGATGQPAAFGAKYLLLLNALVREPGRPIADCDFLLPEELALSELLPLEVTL